MFRAFLSGAALPGIDVSGLDAPDVGLAAEATFVAHPRGIPFRLVVTYRLERFEFPSGGSSRIEEFEQLSVGAGVEFGR